MWTCPLGPSVFFCWAASQRFGSSLSGLWGVIASQIYFCCLTPQVPVSPFPQAVQVSLMGCPAIQHVDSSSQCCVICKPGKSALCPIIQIINEDISADPSTDPWGTPGVTVCRVDFASMVIVDDFSLDMPETSRSGGDLCVFFTFVVRAPVERQTLSTKSTGY